MSLDRHDPEGAIAAAAKAYSNWGRWGERDVLGTLNFLDEAKRREGAALVRRGVSFSLAQSFDMNGPQKGWRRRTNPVHTMLDTGTDAALGNQGFPHGIGGADDVIAMPLQCSTQWDGLGHIFDHGKAWNGRSRPSRSSPRTVISSPASSTWRRTSRDAGSSSMSAEPSERTASCPTGSPSPRSTSPRPPTRTAWRSAAGTSSSCGPDGWPAPGARAGATTRAATRPDCPSPPCGWLHRTEIAAIATDTWGFEVRPNEFDAAFQPLHQVAIPNMGLLIGEMWDLDALAADCAADGRYAFWLTAAPLPITGAVGSPVNPVAVK